MAMATRAAAFSLATGISGVATLNRLRESEFTDNSISRSAADCVQPRVSTVSHTKPGSVKCEQSPQPNSGDVKNTGRREMILQSSSVAVLAAIFHFSGTRPNYIGLRKDPPSLNLCPATPNCISTAEEANDMGHYVPPWTYNPEDGRGKKKPATKEQAFNELLEVIKNTKPDGYTPTIVNTTDDYVYVEYESPTMGFVDDVEFWFPPGDRSLVEYRSASRLGESDLDINRKRIKALRLELQKKGWESVGF
eukprot:TRINITY_DN6302_c1_g1_i2.p1 TRINITY_DN6302_c1_g1~~TRINITY_DN6302_c1_g1_i2.p1  ORF type:complete len:250 (+),score=43.93 TRINITY_DN6302_c1_g1_i2:107-856(+)